ncbi:DUF6461 domain-containing protein [Streptomyces sp. NPDC057291]|uniref:DUF6461 domain-containing protein n=1 Tax=Streptomyces sp. NPDC057291 TaxID=3346087 RepID=UPI0036337A1B
MTTTAADYVWFNERFPQLARAYCITLVHELPPAELLRRLVGQGEPALTGYRHASTPPTNSMTATGAAAR